MHHVYPRLLYSIHVAHNMMWHDFGGGGLGIFFILVFFNRGGALATSAALGLNGIVGYLGVPEWQGWAVGI
jgi:hypothetical protein